jgi:hypothetical protein
MAETTIEQSLAEIAPIQADLGMILPRAAQRFGSKAALIAGDRTFSSQALHDMCGRVASGLHELGVRPGDRVSLYSPNRWEWVVAYHGELRTLDGRPRARPPSRESRSAWTTGRQPRNRLSRVPSGSGAPPPGPPHSPVGRLGHRGRNGGVGQGERSPRRPAVGNARELSASWRGRPVGDRCDPSDIQSRSPVCDRAAGARCASIAIRLSDVRSRAPRDGCQSCSILNDRYVRADLGRVDLMHQYLVGQPHSSHCAARRPGNRGGTAGRLHFGCARDAW